MYNSHNYYGLHVHVHVHVHCNLYLLFQLSSIHLLQLRKELVLSCWLSHMLLNITSPAWSHSFITCTCTCNNPSHHKTRLFSIVQLYATWITFNLHWEIFTVIFVCVCVHMCVWVCVCSLEPVSPLAHEKLFPRVRRERAWKILITCWTWLDVVTALSSCSLWRFERSRNLTRLCQLSHNWSVSVSYCWTVTKNLTVLDYHKATSHLTKVSVALSSELGIPVDGYIPTPSIAWG